MLQHQGTDECSSTNIMVPNGAPAPLPVCDGADFAVRAFCSQSTADVCLCTSKGRASPPSSTMKVSLPQSRSRLAVPLSTRSSQTPRRDRNSCHVHAVSACHSTAWATRCSRGRDLICGAVATESAQAAFPRGDAWAIHKFGGTCVSSADRISDTGDVIAKVCVPVAGSAVLPGCKPSVSAHARLT